MVLVGLEIWNQMDDIHVSPDSNTTLENFLTWRVKKLAGRHHHDNAQLITYVGCGRRGPGPCSQGGLHENEGHAGGRRLSGCSRPHTPLVSSGIDFDGTTVGLAKVSGMCSSQASGAVNQVRRESGPGSLASGWGARLRAGAGVCEGEPLGLRSTCMSPSRPHGLEHLDGRPPWRMG